MTSRNKKSKPTLLVVDDEPDNLDLLYRTFYRDYKVLRAESGPEALDILAKVGEVAVIISDQRMPQMSGTEFLGLTATQYPDTIRIILTGYTDVEDLVEAINSGKVFKYVTKPWKAEELKALVKQALDTHNVLKARTNDLRRALQQESLLYAVTNTIRSAPNYRQMLQRIVETVGQMFEASVAVCCPFQDNLMQEEWFVYQRQEPKASNGEADRSISDNNPPEISEQLLSQIVWETTDVEVIADVESDEGLQEDTPEIQQRKEALLSAGIRSSLVVPLFYRLDLTAVLALHMRDSPRFWEGHEVQLLITVADQAALALSQAIAYEQARSLAQREVLVNSITGAIRSSLDPKNIFAAITEKLGEALEVDGCALSLWTEEDEYVQCVGLYDASERSSVVSSQWSEKTSTEKEAEIANQEPKRLPSADLIGGRMPQSVAPIRGNPVLLQLLKTKQSVAVSDLSERPELNVTELPLRSSARALLVVPLIYDGKIIGSISLRHNKGKHRWLASEIDLARAVASQAAIAVQQSRLYQTTRQQAERLLEADRLKTEFFQNISHEFRTPLTLTIGPLEAAVNHNGDLPKEQAAIALRNCRRLLRLVNQLLDLQRLDAGRMQPSFRPCDFVAFCRNIIESFTPYCEKKGISLISQLSDSCPAVYLDVERFDKVLYNLLSNAMKFTPPGGSITISLEEVGHLCLLQVKDTGIGIKREQIPYLFERFRQAEGSANRSYEGTGLGLALVKELVELHCGQVRVDSTYGEGTTFTIWLETGTHHLPPEQVLEIPADLDSSRVAVELSDVEAELEDSEDLFNNNNNSEDIEPTLGTGTATILVVDDNPDLRNYVARVLKQSNFDVVFGRDGADGFEVAEKYDPDVIVTDLMMPKVSGLDLIKNIRETEKLKGTPVILLTAKADEDTRIEGVEKGADAYLSKPFNDRELLAEVRNLLALKENERRVQELNKYLTESVLRRFLPPEMVRRAAARDLALDLKPEPRSITVLFSDIVGFTRMSNNLGARNIAEVLNEYLGTMTKAIFNNGGTVDKFVGDAVMAIFGSPEKMTEEEQVRRAIASARAMLKALDKLNDRWRQMGWVGDNGVPPVRFRCGINQGDAVVGMFGGEERSDFTAIGPSVNIAARLQEAAQPNTILVSAVVADYLNEAEIEKYGSLNLKGIDESVLSYVVSRDPVE